MPRRTVPTVPTARLGAAGMAERVRYWTTSERPVGEQFSYWREVICEAFTPLAAERGSAHRRPGPREAALHSWVRSTPLTGVNCAEVASGSQLITHGAAEVRRTAAHHLFVNLQLRGTCVGRQNGRECVVSAGDFALFDTTSPYHLDFFGDRDNYEWRVLSFRVPREQLMPLLAQPRPLAAITHHAQDGGLATLVASTMLSIWRGIEELDRHGCAAADSAFTTLVAAAAGGGGGLDRMSRADTDAALRVSIHQYLQTYLRSGDVSAGRIAARFGISRRKLHSLYEGREQTFGQTVLAMRVEGCARQLAADVELPTLTALASEWGFADLSHLIRAFRARFGCSPSAYLAETRSARMSRVDCTQVQAT